MEKNLEIFINLSVEVTGFSKDTIAPSVTNFELPPFYYKEAKIKFGKSFDEMLSAYAQNDLSYVLNKPCYGEMVRQTTFLWYMGAWAINPNDTFGVTTDMINAISYQKGLVWDVMQSHPMGYSKYRYGYWAHLPGELNAYTGN